MSCFKTKNGIRLADAAALDLDKTFTCGQCFRWNADEAGVYTGVVRGRAASVWAEDGGVYTDADADDVQGLWQDYFDLDTDYAAVSRGFAAGDYLARCAEFGRGIRILRQDPWEALCSFILSQCNNIPRIKLIVEALCCAFGEPVRHRDRLLYSFPKAGTMAALAPEDLAVLRCGYRAPYLLAAARAVDSGELDLASLAAGDTEAALRALRAIPGVGEKVANCVVLFGLHKLDAFPVDVWMRRALRAHFPPGFDPGTLGPYAGLAQQYIFYYARSMER